MLTISRQAAWNNWTTAVSVRCDFQGCGVAMAFSVEQQLLAWGDDARSRILNRLKSRGWHGVPHGGDILTWAFTCPEHSPSFGYEPVSLANGCPDYRSPDDRARAWIRDDGPDGPDRPSIPPTTPPRQPDPRLSSRYSPETARVIETLRDLASPSKMAPASIAVSAKSAPDAGHGFVRGHDWSRPVGKHPGYRSPHAHQPALPAAVPLPQAAPEDVPAEDQVHLASSWRGHVPCRSSR